MGGSQRIARYTIEIAATMLKTIGDPRASDDQRATAAKELVKLRPNDDEVVAKLIASVTPQMSLSLSMSIIDALSVSHALTAGEKIADSLNEFTPRLPIGCYRHAAQPARLGEDAAPGRRSS